MMDACMHDDEGRKSGRERESQEKEEEEKEEKEEEEEEEEGKMVNGDGTMIDSY
jgi:hypothetical protein